MAINYPIISIQLNNISFGVLLVLINLKTSLFCSCPMLSTSIPHSLSFVFPYHLYAPSIFYSLLATLSFIHFYLFIYYFLYLSILVLLTNISLLFFFFKSRKTSLCFLVFICSFLLNWFNVCAFLSFLNSHSFLDICLSLFSISMDFLLL